MRSIVSLLVTALCGLVGCAGTEVIPGNNSEREIVIRMAYDYLLETDAIDRTLQYEASISRFVPRLGSGTESATLERPQRRSSWTVKFKFYDAFGAPVAEVSVPVRRYGTPAAPYYEAGSQGA
jgi:hypothetical protein